MKGRALLHLAVHGVFPGLHRYCGGLQFVPSSSLHMKTIVKNFFRPSLASLLASFSKTAAKLEAHAERQFDRADKLRADAQATRAKAIAMDKDAKALVDEAGQAVRVASRINSLLS